MEETTNKSGMSTGMVIGIAVIVAIVSGGGVYAYVNNKAEKEKKDLNAQITELQSQVSSATTVTPSYSTSATVASSVVPDNETTICNQLSPDSKIGGPSYDANARVGDKYCQVKEVSTVYANGISCTAVESGNPGEALECPGSQWIAKKINGKWTKLAEGQNVFPCDILRENDFPKSLLGNDGSCVNSSGQLEQYSN
jgi:outer membrane murein-binding lipoprotein Lpp